MRGGGNSKLLILSDLKSGNRGLRKKFFAFTLAEVLITLGIIGIVAALTIPTLIAKHQKKVYVTQLKKTVNTVLNGYKLMLADNGVDSLQNTELYNWYPTTSPTQHVSEVNLILTKYFNLVKDAKMTSGRDYSPGRGGGPLYNMPECAMFQTADGAEICMVAYNDLFIDVNGYNKLPNKVGVDFFEVRLTDNAKIESANGSYIGFHGTTHPYGPRDSFYKVLEDNWEITYY